MHFYRDTGLSFGEFSILLEMSRSFLRLVLAKAKCFSFPCSVGTTHGKMLLKCLRRSGGTFNQLQILCPFSCSIDALSDSVNKLKQLMTNYRVLKDKGVYVLVIYLILIPF